jgi:hypothetical protein
MIFLVFGNNNYKDGVCRSIQWLCCKRPPQEDGAQAICVIIITFVIKNWWCWDKLQHSLNNTLNLAQLRFICRSLRICFDPRFKPLLSALNLNSIKNSAQNCCSLRRDIIPCGCCCLVLVRYDRSPVVMT